MLPVITVYHVIARHQCIIKNIIQLKMALTMMECAIAQTMHQVICSYVMISSSSATMHVVHVIGKTIQVLKHIALNVTLINRIIHCMIIHHSVINPIAMLNIIIMIRTQISFNHVQLRVCNVINPHQWITRIAWYVLMITAK